MLHLLALLLTLPALARTPDSVSNPRHQGSWVVDEAGALAATSLNEINQKLDALERDTTVEFTVVILKTIDDQVPKAFATDLFQHWGVGKRGKDNGLLLLLVMDQRRAEFETGYGLEGFVTDAFCARVLRNDMVPEFKRGMMGAGVERGVDAVIDQIRAHADEARAGPSLARRLRLSTAEQGALAIGLLILGLLVALNLLARLRARDPYLLANRLAPGGWSTWAVGALLVSGTLFYHDAKVHPGAAQLWPESLALALAALYQWMIMRWKSGLRFAPRACSKCAQPMTRVTSRNELLQYLDAKEAAEERLQSVDYDVWRCRCGNHREDAYEGRLASRFRVCPKCGTKAERLLRTDRIKAATQISNGEEIQHFQCMACSCTRDLTVILPMLSSSTPGSSGSGGGGGGSGGGSSDFGGGSSGGGGAGASW